MEQQQHQNSRRYGAATTSKLKKISSSNNIKTQEDMEQQQHQNSRRYRAATTSKLKKIWSSNNIKTQEDMEQQQHKNSRRYGAATTSKLKKIWSSNNIKTATKIRLYKSLVVSLLTYGCGSWTLKAESERRIAAINMTFFRRILKISYRDHITNISVIQAITEAAGPQESLLARVKRRKLPWFGHTTRHNTLAKNILQGTVKGGRKRGRPQKTWTTFESGRV